MCYENGKHNTKYMPYNSNTSDPNILNAKSQKDTPSSANSLDDIDYYPIQENHKEFVPAAEFQNVDYVNLLVDIQVTFLYFHLSRDRKL